jgi:hypothetical protein
VSFDATTAARKEYQRKAEVRVEVKTKPIYLSMTYASTWSS